MTADNEHITVLKKMKEAMVANRRKFAAQSNVDEVIDYQVKIETIQRAIDDEQRLQGPPTAKFGTY